MIINYENCLEVPLANFISAVTTTLAAKQNVFIVRPLKIDTYSCPLSSPVLAIQPSFGVPVPVLDTN